LHGIVTPKTSLDQATKGTRPLSVVVREPAGRGSLLVPAHFRADARVQFRDDAEEEVRLLRLAYIRSSPEQSAADLYVVLREHVCVGRRWERIGSMKIGRESEAEALQYSDLIGQSQSTVASDPAGSWIGCLEDETWALI